MKINPTELRRSFDSGGSKVSKNFTISADTWNRISRLVPTGHGRYGSTFSDRATRLLLFILDPTDQTLEENQIYAMLRSILVDNDEGDLSQAAERAHYIYDCLRRISQAEYYLSGDQPWDSEP